MPHCMGTAALATHPLDMRYCTCSSRMERQNLEAEMRLMQEDLKRVKGELVQMRRRK
jgi:hypothetical protein